MKEKSRKVLKFVSPSCIIINNYFSKESERMLEVKQKVFSSECLSSYKGSMEELKINLELAVHELIRMFEDTKQLYSCTRIKLGKLLSIFAFKEACKGKLAFSESIVKYSNCGTTINELVLYVAREVYFSDGSKDRRGKINDYLFTGSEDNGWLPLLYSVFIHFGAYPSNILGDMLSTIINTKDASILSDDEVVQLPAIQKLFTDDFDKITESNELIAFLREDYE